MTNQTIINQINELDIPGQYEIKCDFCKTEMGRTDSMQESAMGGYCSDKCRKSNH